METIKTMSDLGIADQLILIFVGFMAAVMIMREAVYWYDRLKNKRNGGHAECGQLAIEVRALTNALNDFMHMQQQQEPARIKMREQVDDLFNWHKPDDQGEQKWKNAALYRNVDRVIGILHSMVEDMNQSFKDQFQILRDLEKKRA